MALPLRWLLASGVCLSCVSCQSPPDPVGEKLYEGELPLVGRLAGDDTALPTAATRCANCHPRSDGPGDGGAPAFGPPLTPAALTVLRRRRGGPPTRYEEATFCKLLETGVDPAYVLIARAMPRYELDAASCRALWNHVSASR
jgi:hypothetical protein